MKNDSTPSEGWAERFDRKFTILSLLNDKNTIVCEEINAWEKEPKFTFGSPNKKIKDFISQEIATARQDERREIIEFVKSNTEGTFTDDAGNDCWYIDDLIKELEEK